MESVEEEEIRLKDKDAVSQDQSQDQEVSSIDNSNLMVASLPEKPSSSVFRDSDNDDGSASSDDDHGNNHEKESEVTVCEGDCDRRKTRVRDEIELLGDNIQNLTISDKDTERIADLVVKKLEEKRIQREARIETETQI